MAKFLLFSKRIHLVLGVHQTPGNLRFRDRCGNSFSSALTVRPEWQQPRRSSG